MVQIPCVYQWYQLRIREIQFRSTTSTPFEICNTLCKCTQSYLPRIVCSYDHKNARPTAQEQGCYGLCHTCIFYEMCIPTINYLQSKDRSRMHWECAIHEQFLWVEEPIHELNYPVDSANCQVKTCCKLISIVFCMMFIQSVRGIASLFSFITLYNLSVQNQLCELPIKRTLSL